MNDHNEIFCVHIVCNNTSQSKLESYFFFICVSYCTNFSIGCTLLFKSLGSVSFYKEINTFIRKGCIKLIKSDIYLLEIILFQINAVLLNFLLVKDKES